MQRMRQQSLNQGTTIITKTVDAVDFSSQPFTLTIGKESIQAKSVIIAT
jgi:thioredoxin reductase